MTQFDGTIALDETELSFSYVRSSGPGGQNVNKVATAVQLRFDVRANQTLPIAVKERLIRLAGTRATNKGEIVIDAQRYRTQWRNRQDSIDRLQRLIKRAATVDPARIGTRPSKSARAKRVEVKKKRSQAKQRRKRVSEESDN